MFFLIIFWVFNYCNNVLLVSLYFKLLTLCLFFPYIIDCLEKKWYEIIWKIQELEFWRILEGVTRVSKGKLGNLVYGKIVFIWLIGDNCILIKILFSLDINMQKIRLINYWPLNHWIMNLKENYVQISH